MSDTVNKKVLHLVRLYPPHIGGVETHVWNLNQELRQRGYQVTVITTGDGDEANIFRIPNETKFRVWLWLWQHRVLLQEADIIHVHDVFWWLWPWYFLVARKVYVTFHGWEGVYPVRWQAKLHRWLANTLSRGSIHVGDWIREFYWDKPNSVTYGGVTAPTVKSTQHLKLQKIVFIGRLTEENDVQKYIKLSKMLGLQITFVGDGPLADICKKAGTVVGAIADPTSIVATADLVFAASYLSILEAQSLGKVVVGLFSNQLKQRYLETYPGAEWMIIGSDPVSIAKLVQKSWNDLKSEHGAQKFAQARTWSKVVDMYEKIWSN